MDTRKLQMLEAAVRLGSLRKAAKECGVSQPAVTQAMDALEDELGFQVICRSRKGVTLTPAGEMLLPSLSKAAAAIDRFQQEAEALAADLHRPLRIGAVGSVAGTWLPQAIAVYRKHEPKATFEVLIGGDSLNQWLEEGKVDLLLAPDCLCGAHRWYPLLDEPCFVALPATAKVRARVLKVEDLKTLPLVMAPRGVAADEVAALAQGNDALTVIACDDDSALVSLAAQGQGAAIVPQSALRTKPENLQIVRLMPPACRTLGVALPSSVRDEAVAFAEYLKKNMPYEDPEDESPEETAMRHAIRRAIAGSAERAWSTPLFK